MKIDPANLPNNPEVLRQMVVDLTAQLDEHERRYQRVQNILEQLLRWRFGQKREKIDERQMFLFAVQWEAEGRSAQQLAEELGLDDEDPLAPAKEPEPKPAKRRGHGRKPLPRSLTRERIEHELSEAERQCPQCDQPMAKIGEEVSERMEYVPASLKVIEDVRAKYACNVSVL